jgi:CheY-like chemotaxis protein
MIQHLRPAFLYVEDDILSCEIMSMLLTKQLRYTNLTILSDNHNFMDKVRGMPSVPDVVFLDIQMHPYDGFEMLTMLRADPVYRPAKIIAMTASVMATDVQALRRAGFDGLIGKPIIRQVFPQLLQQILNGEPVWFIS